MNDILFSKPQTWSGVRRIEVKRWRDDYGFHVTALHLECWPGEKTWSVSQPAESAIWTADGRVLRPAKPKVVLADGLTLRQARRLALQTLEAATSCGAIASEQVTAVQERQLWGQA